MYKVLNQEGDKIIVETINPEIHRHLSGREFTENDACVKTKLEVAPKYVKAKEEDIVEVPHLEELTRKQAIEAYKEKYGRKPSSQMKTENIISKL